MGHIPINRVTLQTSSSSKLTMGQSPWDSLIATDLRGASAGTCTPTRTLSTTLIRRDCSHLAGMLVAGLNIAMDLAIIFWPSCFDGDTLVATEAGFKRIDEVRSGDRVWSCNVETGELALKVVKEVLRRETDELLHIETGSDDVDATTSHPFYVVGRVWVAAGDMAVGDAIQALSGDVRTATALRLEKLESPISVYNLDVEDFDTYFVGSGVLVHNECRKMRSKVENKANDLPERFKGSSLEGVEKTWRHLNFFQYGACLTARVPRVHCDSCGIHLVPVP